MHRKQEVFLREYFSPAPEASVAGLHDKLPPINSETLSAWEATEQIARQFWSLDFWPAMSAFSLVPLDQTQADTVEPLLFFSY